MKSRIVVKLVMATTFLLAGSTSWASFALGALAGLLFWRAGREYAIWHSAGATSQHNTRFPGRSAHN